MIIVDSALEKLVAQNRTINVALIGAGFMSKGIVHQITRYVPGIKIVVICNRTNEHAVTAYELAGTGNIRRSDDPVEIDKLIEAKVAVVTTSFEATCQASGVDLIVESTGHVNHGCQVITCAIANGKPVVNMNAELDATVGCLLQTQARAAGVIVTGCDGDQPATQMNLHRYVTSLGVQPLVCGNIKGLQDTYRTPKTQAAFAKEWGQSATMVTSFADGTKISFEQALVANATGMKVVTRGMLGYHHDGHVDDLTDRYDLDQLRELGGIVDYVVGPKPGPGVFVFGGISDDKTLAHYLNYGKLGHGPLYSFYTPYHLTIMEVQHSIARVALFQDDVISSKGAPMVDVITAAKTDLPAGKTLDGLGGFDTYGRCENYPVAVAENLLPIGIAEGAVLKHAIPKDQYLTYDDVDLPETASVRLRLEQNRRFPGNAI